MSQANSEVIGLLNLPLVLADPLAGEIPDIQLADPAPTIGMIVPSDPGSSELWFVVELAKRHAFYHLEVSNEYATELSTNLLQRQKREITDDLVQTIAGTIVQESEAMLYHLIMGVVLPRVKQWARSAEFRAAIEQNRLTFWLRQIQGSRQTMAEFTKPISAILNVGCLDNIQPTHDRNNILHLRSIKKYLIRMFVLVADVVYMTLGRCARRSNHHRSFYDQKYAAETLVQLRGIKQDAELLQYQVPLWTWPSYHQLEKEIADATTTMINTTSSRRVF